MKVAPVNCFLLFIFCFIYSAGKTQPVLKDSTFFSATISNAVKAYHGFLTPESGLYNGSEYAGYPFRFTEGHQFFEVNELAKGSIVYDGMLYEDVPMQIDLISDHVIINSFEGAYRIQLINEKISSFILLNHRFIQIVKDSTESDIISTGFYDQLYSGNISVFKKEKKKVDENVSITTGITRTVLQENYYYIERNAKYFYVKNKGSLLNVFADRKKDVKQFIRKNKLNFKKDPDNTLIQVAQHFDTPNNNK